MNKTVINESGKKIGNLTTFGMEDLNGHMVGCVAFYGGDIGHVSFCRSIGRMTSGKLHPVNPTTVKLTK